VTLRIRTRGRLPHWEVENGVYFVTFRLFDSLPQKVVRAFAAERRNILATAKQMGRDLSASERRRLAGLFSESIERYLDAGLGACFLKDPRIARLVVNALRQFDRRRYGLARISHDAHAHAEKTQTKGVILSEAKDLNHATPCQPSLVEILRPSSSDGLRMTKGGPCLSGAVSS